MHGIRVLFAVLGASELLARISYLQQTAANPAESKNGRNAAITELRKLEADTGLALW